MDEQYDEMKMNQILESEKIFSLKRNIYEDIEDKSPNKIIHRSQRSEINYSDDSEISKRDNILKINQILKEKNIYQSNNEFLNDRNNPLSNNKEDSGSKKFFRKNTANNKSKDALNYNQLKMDLIQNLENKNKNHKNIKKNLPSIKSRKNDKLISLYKEHIYFYKKKCFYNFIHVRNFILNNKFIFNNSINIIW